MTYYAVIDTNVIVSAMLKWSSTLGNVMKGIFEGKIIPLLNDDIVKEYRLVLSRPKFHLTELIGENFVSSIEEQGIFLDADKLDVELPDPKDIVFYEVVMEGRKKNDAYLVTGNGKHFPSVPFVITPREMLELLKKI